MPLYRFCRSPLFFLLAGFIVTVSDCISLQRSNDDFLLNSFRIKGVDINAPPFMKSPYACDYALERKCASYGDEYQLQRCAAVREGYAASLAASAGAPVQPINDVDGYTRTVHTYTCGKRGDLAPLAGEGCGSTRLLEAPIICLQTAWALSPVGQARAADPAAMLPQANLGMQEGQPPQGPLHATAEGYEREYRDDNGLASSAARPDALGAGGAWPGGMDGSTEPWLNGKRPRPSGQATCTCVARIDFTGRSDGGLPGQDSVVDVSFPLDRRYPDTPNTDQSTKDPALLNRNRAPERGPPPKYMYPDRPAPPRPFSAPDARENPVSAARYSGAPGDYIQVPQAAAQGATTTE